jgi:hypothetical protein
MHGHLIDDRYGHTDHFFSSRKQNSLLARTHRSLSFLEEASNPQFSQLDLLRARIYRGKEMVVVIVLWVRPWIVLALECFSLFFNLVRPWSVKNGIKPDYVDC